MTPEQSLAALVRDAVASGADALGMAGGDGSLAVVAAAALTHGSRSSAFRPGRATTSRWTSGSIGAISWGARGVHRRRRTADRRRDGERSRVPQQRLARRLRGRGGAPPTATRSSARCSRPPRRGSARRSAPSLTSSTTAAKGTAIQPSCWCRTIRTRANRLPWPRRGRDWTALSSESSCSTRPEAAGPPRRVRSAPSFELLAAGGARLHRRRGRGGIDPPPASRSSPEPSRADCRGIRGLAVGPLADTPAPSLSPRRLPAARGLSRAGRCSTGYRPPAPRGGARVRARGQRQDGAAALLGRPRGRPIASPGCRSSAASTMRSVLAGGHRRARRRRGGRWSGSRPAPAFGGEAVVERLLARPARRSSSRSCS